MSCYSDTATEWPCNASVFVQSSVGLIGAVIALIATFILKGKLMQNPMGNDLMNKLQAQIQAGAKSFLKVSIVMCFC